jgi:hypothetical protein
MERELTVAHYLDDDRAILQALGRLNMGALITLISLTSSPRSIPGRLRPFIVNKVARLCPEWSYSGDDSRRLTQGFQVVEPSEWNQIAFRDPPRPAARHSR